MRALVGLGVRAVWGAQQGEPYGRAEPARMRGPRHIVPVRRVVEQRDAVARLGDPQPAVRADLETGRVPAGVGVRRPVHVPELDLGRAPFGVHVEGEGGLEHLLRLVPVGLRDDVEPLRPRVEPHRLLDARRPEGPYDRDLGTQRPCRRQLDGRRVGEVGVLAPVVPVDVPGVVLVGVVGVQLQQIAACAGGQHLAPGGQIPYGREEPVAVHGDAQQAVVEHVRTALGGGGHRVRRVVRPQRRDAERRSGGGQRDFPVEQLLRAGGGRQRPRGVRGEGDDLAPPVRRGVEHGEPGGVILPVAPAQSPYRLRRDLRQLGRHPRVCVAGLAVHPGDGGPGEDVMELVQQHRLPEAVERVVRIDV